ncbi:MAG: alpha/beta fold hydrolase [Anaerolineaceae bacterium]|nr:MAG: alpha/beta fold hydrolase [Anaerolineaceae bacterium]
MTGKVYFNHGKESGPWGDKITRLADVARGRGFEVQSLDYQGMDDVSERVTKLLDSNARDARPLVLVGSSMGSYVAAVASASLRPRGLFLLAPAFYLPEFPIQEPIPHADVATLIHGWNDELIPFSHSIRYAEKFKATLHLVDSDHRLSSQLPLIASLFDAFLTQIV